MEISKQVEQFKDSFFQLIAQNLEYDEFLRKLKENFWLPGKEWLADALPWQEIKKYQLKPLNIHLLSHSKGFITASFEQAPESIITFSLLNINDRWFIDWQNRDVWLLATEKWRKKSIDNIEIRFYDTFSKEKVDSIFEELSSINKWIHNELGINQEKLIIVFGYDALQYEISNTGYKPLAGGGNSRGKLILISENYPNLKNKTIKTTYFKSILLHEMIHEYTCYDKSWDGFVDFPSLKLNLINEGVATYYQYKFYTENLKGLNFDNEVSFIENIKLGIEEALNYKDSILELLSNQLFNIVNRRNDKSAHPAYFLGASLYGYFLKELGYEKIRKLYSVVGKMESKEANIYLLDYFNEKNYIKYAENYLNNLINQFNL